MIFNKLCTKEKSNATYPHKIVQINYTSWADLFIVVPYL